MRKYIDMGIGSVYLINGRRICGHHLTEILLGSEVLRRVDVEDDGESVVGSCDTAVMEFGEFKLKKKKKKRKFDSLMRELGWFKG